MGLEEHPHRRRFVGHRVGRHRRPIGRDGGAHRGEVSACGSLLVTRVGRHRRHDTAAAAVTHCGRRDERTAAGRRTAVSGVTLPQCRHPCRLPAGRRLAAGGGGGGGGGRRAWAEDELLFGRLCSPQPPPPPPPPPPPRLEATWLQAHEMPRRPRGAAAAADTQALSPPTGGLKKLRLLELNFTQVADASCAALAAAFHSGALPSLEALELLCIPASAAAITNLRARVPKPILSICAVNYESDDSDGSGEE